MPMVHRNCGGTLVDDPKSPPYEHEGMKISVTRCAKCSEEIVGDAQIEFTGKDAWMEEERSCR